MRHMVVVGSKRMVQYQDTSSDESVRIYDRGLDVSIAEAPATFGEYQLMPARPQPWTRTELRPNSSAATFPVLSISPLDRGSNGAGVWFIRNTKHLGRQTALTASVESKSFLAAVATLSSRFTPPALFLPILSTQAEAEVGKSGRLPSGKPPMS